MRPKTKLNRTEEWAKREAEETKDEEEKNCCPFCFVARLIVSHLSPCASVDERARREDREVFRCRHINRYAGAFVFRNTTPTRRIIMLNTQNERSTTMIGLTSRRTIQSD